MIFRYDRRGSCEIVYIPSTMAWRLYQKEINAGLYLQFGEQDILIRDYDEYLSASEGTGIPEEEVNNLFNSIIARVYDILLLKESTNELFLSNIELKVLRDEYIDCWAEKGYLEPMEAQIWKRLGIRALPLIDPETNTYMTISVRCCWKPQLIMR